VEKNNSVDELVTQLDEFRQTHPALVESYRQFLESYSKFRRLEEQMSGKRSSTLQLLHDANLPA
jgi:hypothetical protein